MNDKNLSEIGLRIYTLLKEIRSKSEELERLRLAVSENYAAGSDVYISNRQKERVVLGPDYNRAVNPEILKSVAGKNPALMDELHALVLDKIFDITVAEFNALLIEYPDIATALYHKAKKPTLSIKPFKP